MKKTVVLIGAIIMALSLCSCKPAVAKKAVKFTQDFIENKPKSAAGVISGGYKAVKYTHKCSCENGKVYNYGYWVDCKKCGGKGWYYSKYQK